MRWSGQEIDVEQADALPGLAKLNALVRSVQSPEFAGVTFHEILAKSALNHVPGASNALPFGWTINPYRGCTHACVYCVSPDTLVQMVDGRLIRIADIQVGDEIVGTRVEGTYRRFVGSRVLAKWTSRKRAFRVTLADGTQIVASGDHRFLTERGWKHVRPAESRGQRPYLTLNNRMMGFGLAGLAPDHEAPVADRDYRLGYLTGMIRGDGMIFRKEYQDETGRVRSIHRFRLALADSEALDRSRDFLKREGVDTDTRSFATAWHRRPMSAIQTAKKANVDQIEALTRWPTVRSSPWHAGFLAGIFDAEGSCSRGILRISNKSPEILAAIGQSMDALGVSRVIERANERGVANVRLVGGQAMRSRFLRMTAPAISRKLDIRGRAVKSSVDLRIVSIEDTGTEIEMVDITTGTGDFIANGIVAHNCFARPTHEYLELNAGRDFDSQIIVKVNIAEVLRKELARPSWEHPTVALGTNTDPYQRAEGRYRLMPGIIAALAASGTPFSILTKGTLLRRDIPLLQAAAEHVPVSVAMSIAVFDPELQASVEPGTPSTAARLATVRAVREAGLPCTVLVMPVLPHLTDTREHLDRAFGMLAEAGASSVAYSALHLRGSVKPWFMAWLAEFRPDLVPRYEELYRAGAYAPKDYRRWLAARARPLLRRHGLDRPFRDPTTGAPAPLRGTTGSASGRSLLAAELPPDVAAAIQPTLF